MGEREGIEGGDSVRERIVGRREWIMERKEIVEEVIGKGEIKKGCQKRTNRKKRKKKREFGGAVRSFK